MVCPITQGDHKKPRHRATLPVIGGNYLRQGGYVFVVICLSVGLLATLRKNFRTDLHEIFREGWLYGPMNN